MEVEVFIADAGPAVFSSPSWGRRKSSLLCSASAIKTSTSNHLAGTPGHLSQSTRSSNLRPPNSGFSSFRLGFRQITGLKQVSAERIMKERKVRGPFTSIAELGRRTGLTQAVITKLSQADAFASLKQSRRSALWQALGQEKKPIDQPLLAGLDDRDDDAAFCLPKLEPQQEVVEDYRSIGFSPEAMARA